MARFKVWSQSLVPEREQNNNTTRDSVLSAAGVEGCLIQLKMFSSRFQTLTFDLPGGSKVEVNTPWGGGPVPLL